MQIFLISRHYFTFYLKVKKCIHIKGLKTSKEVAVLTNNIFQSIIIIYIFFKLKPMKFNWKIKKFFCYHYLQKMQIYAIVRRDEGEQGHPVVDGQRVNGFVRVKVKVIVVLVALLGHVRLLEIRRVDAEGAVQRGRALTISNTHTHTYRIQCLMYIHMRKIRR